VCLWLGVFVFGGREDGWIDASERFREWRRCVIFDGWEDTWIDGSERSRDRRRDRHQERLLGDKEEVL
jgi:hypothetical protein